MFIFISCIFFSYFFLFVILFLYSIVFLILFHFLFSSSLCDLIIPRKKVYFLPVSHLHFLIYFRLFLLFLSFLHKISIFLFFLLFKDFILETHSLARISQFVLYICFHFDAVFVRKCAAW